MKLDVDIDRCVAEIDRLAQFSDVPPPAVKRVQFTQPDREARQYLKRLFAESGLTVREDAVGNIFARWDGSEPNLPAAATGSHTDAIPYSGRFDGTVGVLGGLEAIRALQRTGVRPRRSIELVMFTSEEPTRFGYGCLGSRILSGQLSSAAASLLKDESGVTLDEARTEAGCAGLLTEVKLQQGHYSNFVELHIEQGPLLETAGVPIGAVTAIAAPSTLRVRYHGPGGHAGTVLMSQRIDPLLAAAALALEVEAAVLERGGRDTVGTVGVLDVHPRAVNSIPRDVTVEIDVRDVNGARRDRVLQRISCMARHFGERRRTATSVEMINADPPAICEPSLVESIERASDAAGLACQRMISRAYHDSLFMSLVCPVSMIFIPCRDGVSHRPEEYASPDAIRNGVDVLARTLLELAT